MICLVFAQRLLACGGVSLLAPSPLRGEGWDEGRVSRCPLWGMVFGWSVARLLACGGLSDACRRPGPMGEARLAPSPLRGEGWDEGGLAPPYMGHDLVARLLTCGGLSDACRRPSYFSLLAQREVAKRNGLSSPPTLQAL